MTRPANSNNNARDNDGLCKYCKDRSPLTENHKRTINHRYHFLVGTYKEYRKALVKNRHGIEIAVIPENPDLKFTSDPRKGKNLMKISAEQLALNGNTITFKCCVKNTNKKSAVYLTSADLLHPSQVFQFEGKNQNEILNLLPGATYSNFKITFKISEFFGSYKVPFSFDFQTRAESKPEESFTIVRSIVVADVTESSISNEKSPFTSKPFADVTQWRNPTSQIPYTDRYAIPKPFIKPLKYGLKRFSTMNSQDEEALNTLLHMTGRSKGCSPDNYRNFWHVVLWLEEIAETMMLRGYNMENVKVTIKNSNILELIVPGLAEKRPSVIVGDLIHIRIHEDYKAYKGIVKRVKDQTVEIHDVHEELFVELKTDPDMEMDVAFLLNRLSFERCHEAVDKVCSKNLVSSLFPTRILRTPNHYKLIDNDFYNEEIIDNAEQRNAVTKILNNNRTVPYIVFGPPGTGKTITIVEAILQLKKNTDKKILVCAPANSACDMIATKLMRHCERSELIRIHSSTREFSTVTDSLKAYSNVDEDDGDAIRRITLAELVTYRIVVTTLILIGRYRDYKPDYVFIDEAAQASEPETDIAIGLLSAGKQIVLAGDPKQLGPMINSTCAEEYGLGISLLERLMGFAVYQPNGAGHYNNDVITMLILNFRSHEHVLEIPNELFYDSKLIPVSIDAKEDPLVAIAIYPIIYRLRRKCVGGAVEFCALSSKEKREGASPSYFNLEEVKMVEKYVHALMNTIPLHTSQKPDQEDIGIVTPYKRQVFKIKEKLRMRGYERVEVGTTESFQGREKRIIIISTVRAQHSLLRHDKKFNLGFVRHSQRFNVALTRAKSKLIVIGNQPVLSTDHQWQRIISNCRARGTYFGAPYVDRNDRFKEQVVDRMRNFKATDDQYRHQQNNI